MDKHVVSTTMHTILEVEVGPHLVEFKIGKKEGGDAEIRVDRSNWVSARVLSLALASFEERFPMAFLEKED